MQMVKTFSYINELITSYRQRNVWACRIDSHYLASLSQRQERVVLNVHPCSASFHPPRNEKRESGLCAECEALEDQHIPMLHFRPDVYFFFKDLER